MGTRILVATFFVLIAGLLSADRIFARSAEDSIDSVYDGSKYVMKHQILPARPHRSVTKPQTNVAKPRNQMTWIHHSTGKVQVATRYADRFECLFDRLEDAGYKPDPRHTAGWRASGTYGACHPPRSMHPCGYAVDISQTARNQVTRPFPANINTIARGCGLFHGAEWSWADRGHFEVRTEVAWSKKPHPVWPTVLATLGDTPVRMETDDPRVSLDEIQKDRRGHAKLMMDAAVDHGIDPIYQLSMVHMESSFNPALQARRSSAYGMCQLLKYERLHVYNIGERPSVFQQARACALKTKQNLNLFRDIFQAEPTIQDLYLIHWQGIGGAVLIKLANENDSLEGTLNKWQFYRGHERDYGSWVVKANPVMRGMTVGKYLEHIDRRSRAAIKLVSD